MIKPIQAIFMYSSNPTEGARRETQTKEIKYNHENTGNKQSQTSKTQRRETHTHIQHHHSQQPQNGCGNRIHSVTSIKHISTLRINIISEEMIRKRYQANGPKKQAGVAILAYNI